jgi:hypothetical protein
VEIEWLDMTATSAGAFTYDGSTDADGDGLSDDWEQQIIDADTNDAILTIDDVLPDDDFDGDGENNSTEQDNDTDPTDATSTYDPANAYAAFHLEIYQGADQMEDGTFDPSFWGAELTCLARGGETFSAGTMTKPTGSGGDSPVALNINQEGDEAQYAKKDYTSLNELMTDFVAGDYKVNLEAQAGGHDPYHLRFNITLPSYAEDYFPEYITVENPSPDEVDTSPTPLLDFDSELWDYLEVAEADTGEMVYYHFRDMDDDPADTHQVPEEHELEPETYSLEVDINDWGTTWLGSKTRVQFTCVEPCDGDFEPDGDVDGSDLATFAADFGRTDCVNPPPCEGDFDSDGDVDGSDLASFASEFGRTDCLAVQ